MLRFISTACLLVFLPTGGQANPVPLSSPLDRLDSKEIPEIERFAWQPKELVAVIGSHRGQHGGWIDEVAQSADGKLIASGGRDNPVRVWDAAALREMHVLGAKFQRVNSLAFAADNRLLAAGIWSDGVHVWDLSQHPAKLRWRIEGEDSALFGPNGNLVAWGRPHDHDFVRVWDLKADKPKLQHEIRLDRPVQSVALSPDGKTMAIVHYTGCRLITLMPTSHKERAFIKMRDSCFISAAFSADGKTLAIGEGAEPKTPRWPRCVLIFDVGNGAIRQTATLEGMMANVTPVAFVGPSQQLATLDWDGVLRVFDLSQTPPKTALHDISANTFAVSPNGRELLTGSAAGAVQAWRLTGDRLDERLTLRGQAVDGFVAIAADGKSLMCGSSRNGVMSWEFGAKAPRPREMVQTTRNYACLSGDQGTLALYTSSSQGKRSSKDYVERGEIEIWKLNGGTPKKHAEIVVPKWIRDVELNATGTLAAVVDLKGVGVWDLRGPNAMHRRGHDLRGYTSLRFVNETELLLGIDREESITAFDGQTEPSTNNPFKISGKSERIYEFVVSPDGRTLALQLEFRPETQLWNIGGDRPKLQATLRGHKFDRREMSRITCRRFSPSSSLFVSTDTEGRVMVWNLRGEKLNDWHFPFAVHDACFAADGRHLATLNANGTIYVLRI